MKRAGLWIGVAALVLLGVVMVVSALSVHQMYPVSQSPLVYEHDQKLHRMLEEEQIREQHEEYKIEFQYLTMAALEFSVAAFVAGWARRR
jgi:putative Mn2+ efflux pump MntP